MVTESFFESKLIINKPTLKLLYNSVTNFCIVIKEKGREAMRTELRRFFGERLRFTAIVDRTGIKKNRFANDPLITQLLLSVKIKECGTLVANHVWVNCTKIWRGTFPGDEVEFTARITEYVKGHFKEDIQSIDYKLSYITKVVVTKRKPLEKTNKYEF